ncbi:AMP-binding protein [Acanthopleuribacter pedis]|uniref:AMP-binding protein n=1 Tax=Acanthopleuribacter pedis TaxID=442870 RepID=A0A8J7Q8K4_9BACT|nr:AMP-binding protein [Acanthopleuribacter pedis]MBO1319419.1 AMP-binding protein [Acanthopleuribacter pedis]
MTHELFGSATNLVTRLRDLADNQGEKPAFDFLNEQSLETTQLRFSDLDLRARAVAGAIQQAGIRERALLLFDRPGDFVGTFFGCLYAGVVPVPAYPPTANPAHWQRLERIAVDAAVDGLLSSSKLLPAIESALQHKPTFSRVRLLAVDSLDDSAASFWQPPTLSGDSLAFLQYTSGSTGDPKGVQVTHANLMANIGTFGREFGFHRESHMVSWLPLFHDMGLIGCMLGPAIVGCRAFLMSPTSFIKNPVRWLQSITRFGGTISGGPNFAYDLCSHKITEEQQAALDLSTWEVAFNASEPIRAATLKRFAKRFAAAGLRGSALKPSYGLAEATLFVCGVATNSLAETRTVSAKALAANQTAPEPVDAADRLELVASGRINRDQQVRIVAPESLETRPDGEIGEIWVQGSGVTLGYRNRPEQNQRDFAAHTAEGDGPYLRTGDLGFVQAGSLYVTGRIKDLLIFNGRNLYPSDIEHTVERTAPGLRPGCGAAVSVAGEAGEELVILQEIAPRHFDESRADDTVQAIREKVWHLHGVQPVAVVLLPPKSIPKTSCGKLQRYQARRGFLDRAWKPVAAWHKTEATATAEITAPAATPRLGDIHRLTREHLAATMGLSNAGALPGSQKLFELGLDSIGALEFKGRLEDEFNCELEAGLVFDYPTIDDLVAHLAETCGLQPQPTQNDADLDAMNEDQLAELLAQELGSSQGGR